MIALPHLTAAPIVVRVGVNTFTLGPLTVADYGLCEQALVAARPDPLAELAPRLADLPETAQRELLSLAYDELLRRDAVTTDELSDWFETRDGAAYTLWLAARKYDDRLTVDYCAALVDELPLADWPDLQRQLDAVRGLSTG